MNNPHKLTELQLTILQAWVTGLRSTRYVQARGRLRRILQATGNLPKIDAMCCLGCLIEECTVFFPKQVRWQIYDTFGHERGRWQALITTKYGDDEVCISDIGDTLSEILGLGMGNPVILSWEETRSVYGDKHDEPIQQYLHAVEANDNYYLTFPQIADCVEWEYLS